MSHVDTNKLRRALFLARGGQIHGSQRQLCYLIHGLDRSRFEPVVVVDRPGPLYDFLKADDVEVHIAAMHAWRSFPAGMLQRIDASGITRLAKRRRADLIHAVDAWRSGYMHFAAGRLGVPSVLHVRGPMSGRDILKHQVAQADGVISIAQRYHEDLISAGVSPERIAVIDDAVDLERFKPGLASRRFLQGRFGSDSELFVGLVGRVDPFKRVLEFLQAIAPLAENRGSSVTYLVIGQPGRRSYCQAVLRAVRDLGLTDCVCFADHDKDIAETVSAMDILVTMSGGSIMFEAMACAKPVLSVRTDARHSVHTRHDETAWCVTTDSPEPVTEALAGLIDDADLRQRLGAAARQWAQRHLSLETMAARTQDFYDQLLESRESSAGC